jgi:hypothetical protein
LLLVTLPLVTLLRRTLVLATAAAVIVLVACDDPFAPSADTPTLDASIEVWALTGSPSNYPTVMLVPQRISVRPDAAASFDLGFDIDSVGRLLVLPVSNVVTNVTFGDRRVGIIRTSDIYNTITEAPRDGWIFDSTLAVNVGQVFIVRVQTQFCEGRIQNEIYAKYQVDSVLPAERRIRLSGRVNPNCGFRSFLSGIPKF